MALSSERILTTHAGSLPRPARLLEPGVERDPARYADLLRESVAEIVRRQTQIGLDIVDDGELGKPSFITYVHERLGGFELDRERKAGSSWAGSREFASFPEFYEQTTRGAPASAAAHMVCTAPIKYRGHQALKRDIDNLKAAMAETGVQKGFMPAISPTNVAYWNRNAYYRGEEEYTTAIAEAMREEYRAIADAGLTLQIDDPRLVSYYAMTPGVSIAQCREWAERRVATLNYALHGIAPEKVRFHTCYSINMGPRIHDLELKDIVDVILKINAGCYSFEAANPRHEHEWRVWERVKLAPGKCLIPGVITHCSLLVEHPGLVAERLVRLARLVGRENVIAGADCGFGTFAGAVPEVHPSIVWAKFQSLVEGARIASRELWSRAA